MLNRQFYTHHVTFLSKSDPIYPAAYSNVISVASIDPWYGHSWFSQTNSQVSLSAPGEEVLSTVPLNMGFTAPTVTVGDLTVTGKWIDRSPMPPSEGLTGRTLVYCPKLKSGEVCPGPGGHFCVYER